jgi:ubiquinone/menaquinone biosynthesis C-methylase UbiE
MEPWEPSAYVLRGGDQGAERLRLLARVKWPTTKALLRRVELKRGMSCLDAGCGIGAVTLQIARRVGPAGQVVGIDVDERCLALARQEAVRRNRHAVFRAERVTDLREEAAYDLVYGRFLLTHLPEPGRALERLVRALRPGGQVVVEDVDFTGHFCYPACPAFERYVTLYQRVVRAKGGDADIGPRLPGLVLDAGAEAVRWRVIQPVFQRGLGKRIAPVTMEHVREAVVAAGLATEAEVTAIVSELNAFVRRPRTILSLPRIFQVWGRRPSEPS